MSNINPYITPRPDDSTSSATEHPRAWNNSQNQTTWSYPPQPPTSGMAVASMVLGIVGATIGWFLLGIPAFLAIIFGHIALTEIKKGAKSGKGMAVAGLVLGYIVGSIVVIGILAVAYGA